MIEYVWVEHPALGAPPRRVTKERFEKSMGAKGWVLCERPADQPPPKTNQSDVQRREELAVAMAEARKREARVDPAKKRRQELRKVRRYEKDPNARRAKEFAEAQQKKWEESAARAAAERAVEKPAKQSPAKTPPKKTKATKGKTGKPTAGKKNPKK